MKNNYLGKPKVEFSNKDILNIYDTALKIDNGIYVKSNNHPCGWDFITFDHFYGHNDIINSRIDLIDISNNIYKNHEFEYLTLLEVIQKVGHKGFFFEKSHIII